MNKSCCGWNLNRRSRFIVTIGLVLAIDTNAVKAQPAPELDRLKYFEGVWTCQQPAAPAKPAGIFSWTVKQDLNQFWYLGNAEEIKSANDELVNSREFMGYNAASKKLTRSVVVSNGNSYNLTADNWQNDKLVWSGTLIRKGQATPLREEIIKDSSDKFTATYFVPGKNGWTPVVNETCDRPVPR